MTHPPTRLALRLARHMQPSGSGCWLWTGAKNEHGYGVLGRGRRGQGSIKAHRAVYELFHGVELDASTKVLHGCDNPACVNPLHLTAGTQADNVADMWRKGRGSLPPVHRGEQHPKARLSNESVQLVFELRQAGWSMHRIARHLGVTRPAIGAVLNRQTWKHINVANHHR